MAFENTKLALEIYDRSAPARARAWLDAESEAAVEEANMSDVIALGQVQHAFWQDTKHINSRQNCALVDLPFMRRLAEEN